MDYAKAYKDNCVDSDGSYTKSLIKQFGMERVLNMYAVTVRANRSDGRISDEIKELNDTSDNSSNKK